MLNLVFRLPYWAEKNYYTNLRSYNWDWQLYISSLYLKVKFPQCKYITLFDAYHAVDQIDFNYFQNAHEKWCQAPEYLCKLNIPPASTLRLSAHPPLSCYHCFFSVFTLKVPFYRIQATDYQIHFLPVRTTFVGQDPRSNEIPPLSLSPAFLQPFSYFLSSSPSLPFFIHSFSLSPFACLSSN